MIFLFLIFVLIANEIIIRNNFLLDNIRFSKHKSFVSPSKIPTTGGLFLLLFIFLFQSQIGLINLFYLSSIFLIGLSSDRIKNFSPSVRLFLQIFITFLFITNTETLIIDVRIDDINLVLNQNESISIIFTIFCFIVLMNGTNFIDGVNLNAIGFYILIYLIIFIVSKLNNLNFDLLLNLKIILFLVIIYILNFFNKLQLGDAGSYLLAFYTSFYIIQFTYQNPLVSPYFAVLILWYPCFENLFSICRKIYQKKKISTADNLHLHQNIFFFLKIKNFKNLNNLSGLVINLSNLLLLSFSINVFNSTKYLVLLILLNIFVYIFVYNILINNILSKKFKKKNSK
tara:strand:- start:6657 stop:7682 length:1026 start_codon:yes stop_codon:yes gene_type:complete